MTDSEIIVLAADFKSTSMACGVMVDDFDAVGFARAIEQASRRTALSEAARLVELNGYDGAAFDIRALAASDSDGGKDE